MKFKVTIKKVIKGKKGVNNDVYEAVWHKGFKWIEREYGATEKEALKYMLEKIINNHL